MPATWYTADPHYDHPRIIELCNRPFADVDAMNEALVDNWNANVSKYDRVFILGDLALGKLDHSLSYIPLLNGTKILVPGNHDRAFPAYRKKGVRPADVEHYTRVGLTIADPMVVDHHGWTLCHFPDVVDDGIEAHEGPEDRWAPWRPATPRRDEVLLHGHVHNAWRVRGRRLNVGVDVNDFRPIHEDEVLPLLEAEGS